MTTIKNDDSSDDWWDDIQSNFLRLTRFWWRLEGLSTRLRLFRLLLTSLQTETAGCSVMRIRIGMIKEIDSMDCSSSIERSDWMTPLPWEWMFDEATSRPDLWSVCEDFSPCLLSHREADALPWNPWQLLQWRISEQFSRFLQILHATSLTRWVTDSSYDYACDAFPVKLWLYDRRLPTANQSNKNLTGGTFNSSRGIYEMQSTSDGLQFTRRILNRYCCTNERHIDALYNSSYD